MFATDICICLTPLFKFIPENVRSVTNKCLIWLIINKEQTISIFYKRLLNTSWIICQLSVNIIWQKPWILCFSVFFKNLLNIKYDRIKNTFTELFQYDLEINAVKKIILPKYTWNMSTKKLILCLRFSSFYIGHLKQLSRTAKTVFFESFLANISE